MGKVVAECQEFFLTLISCIEIACSVREPDRFGYSQSTVCGVLGQQLDVPHLGSWVLYRHTVSDRDFCQFLGVLAHHWQRIFGELGGGLVLVDLAVSESILS